MSDFKVLFFFFSGSIFLLISGIRYLYLYIEARNKNNKKIKGIITRYSYRGTAPRGTFYYVISFNYNGKSYDRNVESFLKTFKKGDELTVIVNPQKIEKQSKVLVVEDCKLYVPIIMLILGIVFAVMGYLLYRQ